MRFDQLVEERIQAGRKAGLFDGLAGRGKPIADIHKERPAGWWALRLLHNERSNVKREDLKMEVSEARRAFMQAGSETELRNRIGDLNIRIDQHNALTRDSRLSPFPRLDPSPIVQAWHRHRTPSSAATREHGTGLRRSRPRAR